MTAAEIANWALGALGTLLSGGGLVALYKARSENRVALQKVSSETQVSLSSSESAFRREILDELRAVKAKNEELTNQLTEQKLGGARRDEQIAILANTIDRYQVVILERDMAIRDRDRAVRLLESSERKAELERETYARQISELETRVSDLTKQVEELSKQTKDGTNDQASA